MDPSNYLTLVSVESEMLKSTEYGYTDTILDDYSDRSAPAFYHFYPANQKSVNKRLIRQGSLEHITWRAVCLARIGRLRWDLW